MTAELVTNFQWVTQLIATTPQLAAMPHSITERNGAVAVEVEGAHWEARVWRHAIDGRIMPSHVDVHGVRRQLVIGLRVQICIIEDPRKAGA